MNDAYLKLQRPLQDYITYFEKLNTRSIRLIEKIASPGIYFKDPFNEVTGIEAVEAIFEHMFETLDNPKFRVSDYGFGQKENTAYIRWQFSYTMKNNPYAFDGMSEVIFNDEGQVISHIDYWDAGEHVYERVPVLGTFIGFVKSKLASQP